MIDHFRSLVEKAGGGNYQTLINDALVSYIEQGSVLALPHAAGGVRELPGTIRASARCHRKRDRRRGFEAVGRR